MKGRFLLGSNGGSLEGNIYADKSSVVLDWLLRPGVTLESFSLRRAAKDCGVSVGLVQKVFAHLVLHGLLDTTGVRTAKRFSVSKPAALLQSWLENYSIVKKCRMWTYRSGFQDRDEILAALKSTGYSDTTVLALHSAAEKHGCKNTNLNTVELYMLTPNIRSHIEQDLALEPQERGYEVLLIEPYYKGLLSRGSAIGGEIGVSPALLTLLDLYHFPLRGREQAEFMIQRLPELKLIYGTR